MCRPGLSLQIFTARNGQAYATCLRMACPGGMVPKTVRTPGGRPVVHCVPFSEEPYQEPTEKQLKSLYKSRKNRQPPNQPTHFDSQQLEQLKKLSPQQLEQLRKLDPKQLEQLGKAKKGESK